MEPYDLDYFGFGMYCMLEYIRLDAVKEEYGSIEDYIRSQLGVSDEVRNRLREK